MLRKFLFYTEIILTVLVTFVFLIAWMAFSGPQMHVAETFAGLTIAFLILVLGVLWARRRLRRREAAAEALLREAELARQRAEEEQRIREAWEEEVRVAEREAKWQAEREERLRRATESARRKSSTGPRSTKSSEAVGSQSFDARAFIDELLFELDEQEQLALSDWLKRLLEIRELRSTNKKVRSLGASLKSSRALAPVAKLVLIKLKKHGWDDLGGIAKWTVAAGGAGLLLFGGAGAGIAAFGGAIGVPLFVVFGAGGALAGTIVQEIERRSKK